MKVPLGLAALTVLDTGPMGQIDLAQAHGFDTIGVRLSPAAPGTTAYPLHDDPVALREVVARLADSPVTVFDVEIVRLGADFDVDGVRGILDAARRLGARVVLVGADDRDRARLKDSYAALADACAQQGLVAGLEFMPWTAVPDVTAAMDVVAAADPPGRSLLVDALHVARSATTIEQLRHIPAEWIHYVQLCDGSVPAPEDDEELVRQAREERLVPGEGGIDLEAIYAAMPAGTPVSVELPNEPARRAVGTPAWLDRLVASTSRVVEAATRTDRHR